MPFIKRRVFYLAMLVCCLAQWIAATRLPAASVPANGPTPAVMKNIPYGEGGGDVRQSFDLYLPAKTNAKHAACDLRARGLLAIAGR